MRRSILASAVVLTLLLPLHGVAANHPAEGPCTSPVEGDAYVVLSPATGAVQPYCTTISNGDRVTWVRGEAFDPSGPENGCFSATDAGPFRFGDRFTVRFTWDTMDAELRIRAWDSEGEPVVWHDFSGLPIEEKTCSNGDFLVEDGRVTVPWHTRTRSAVGTVALI